jgi:UPF0755 protein
MPPERNRQRPSLEGVRRQVPQHRQPEYRADHELPPPPKRILIRDHESEAVPQTPPPVGEEHVSQKSEQPQEAEVPPQQSSEAEADTEAEPTLDDIKDEEPQKPRKKHWLLIIGGVLVVALIVAAGAAYAWYQGQLSPVSSDTTKHVRVVIAAGSTPNAIAEQLETSGTIRSKTAFSIYAKLSGAENKLKAGTYSIQPSLSTPAIIDHLVAGKQDTFNLMFLPGDTLSNNRDKMIALGYSESDVDAALKKPYDSPLFATKPASNDLEGYFYGETNEFDTSATPQIILERYFDQYNDFIQKNNIVAGFQKQGLTLYQGITLASIVQREVGTKDMPQVARVFLNRLKAGMTLGSDVTYQYAAKKLGVAPDPALDSPYNTRKYPGLPPGPIATPGNTALLAVANPGDNNYLFFLSGDDDVTYYATTDAQHQQNIVQHCQKKCSVN